MGISDYWTINSQIHSSRDAKSKDFYASFRSRLSGHLTCGIGLCFGLWGFGLLECYTKPVHRTKTCLTGCCSKFQCFEL
jgi:hypothetical protein